MSDKPSKFQLVQSNRIVKLEDLSLLSKAHNTHPVSDTCNSCKVVWCATSQEVLDRFVFRVPGTGLALFEKFVCPECGV